MLTELSLNVLDIVNNSIRANATVIEIDIRVHRIKDTMTITIADNGCGMSKEQLEKVEDPFYTTRTTRGVGLGIPFFKQSALCTGGSFHIESIPNEMTKVTAVFGLSHVDRMPLGDINSTIYNLIITNPQIDFIYNYELDGKEFQLDTRQLREILDGIPLNTPEVSAYIKEYLKENQDEVNDGYIL